MPNLTADKKKVVLYVRNDCGRIKLLVSIKDYEKLKQELSLCTMHHSNAEKEISALKKQIDDKEAHIMLLINDCKRLEKQLSQSVSKEKIKKIILSYPKVMDKFIATKCINDILSLSQNDTHPEKEKTSKKFLHDLSTQGENFQDKEE